ncbi:hypothetical protein WN943_006999 [Citrus x changshan-huyou]
MLQGLRNLLSTREPETRPVCAVIDVMMGWTADVFKNCEVPIVGFFTSGACSAAVECAMPHGPLPHGPPPLRDAPGSEKMGPLNPVINHTG